MLTKLLYRTNEYNASVTSNVQILRSKKDAFAIERLFFNIIDELGGEPSAGNKGYYLFCPEKQLNNKGLDTLPNKANLRGV